MIDTKELRLLVQAVIGWGCCNQAWLDQSEDTPAVVVGHINEDGETYPVVTIDCDQYSAAGQSLPLGKFYAAANPAVINEILNRLEAAEEDAAHQKALADSALRVAEGWEEKCHTLRAKIERMDGALESLLIRCDDSDSAMYGTLSTSFVRDTVRIARGEQE